MMRTRRRQAARQAAATDFVGQHVRDLLEQPIARHVAAGVVDDLN